MAKKKQFSFINMMAAVGCLAAASSIVAHCVHAPFVDAEETIVLPMLASPFLALMVGYGISRLTGRLLESIVV